MKPRYGLALTALTALALAAVAACGGGGPGTSLFVNVTNPGKPAINHLYVAGVTDAGMQAFAPAVLSRKDGGELLQTAETLRILLPDALEGQKVFIGLAGLSGSTPVSFALGNAVVVKGREVEVPMTLAPMTCPTGTRQDAESKLCVCDRSTCSGCCKMNNKREATCVTQLSPSYCDTEKCTTTQGCTCGLGQCKEGQRCDGNVCKCDEKLCDGCCSLNTCVARAGGNDNPALACGNTGAKCDACGPGGGPCSDAGVCTGNTVLCPQVVGQPLQCKTGTHCEALSFPRCGDERGCLRCNPLRSDRCDERGQCVCGTNSGPGGSIGPCGLVNGVDTICSNGRCIPPP